MMPADADRLAYSVPRAAAALDVSRAQLYVLMRDGALRSFTCGARRLISRDALADYVQRREQAAAEGAGAAP